jgi:hypothetical protein
MVQQNLITSLPFFDGKEKQTFRQAKGTEGALPCRYDRILPFAIKRTPAAAPTYIYLVKSDDSVALNITSLLTIDTVTVDGVGFAYWAYGSDHSQVSAVQDYRWIAGAWSANTTKTWAQFVEEGEHYYLEVSFSGTKFYSELMRISDFPETTTDPSSDCGSYIRIEGANTCAVGDLPAALNMQKLFIEGKTSDPEYLVEKDVAPDGQDEDTALWVKLKKRYKITFHAIEPVVDWLTTLPLYGDFVNVVDQYGYQAVIRDIVVEVTWPQDFGGWLAQVEFSYSITYITTTGCC